MNLFNKARTFVLASLHRLLDAAIDLNSVEAVKVHIRDLESAREDMEGELAVQRHSERTLRADVEKLRNEIATTRVGIGTLLNGVGGGPNQAAAEDLAKKVIRLERELKMKEPTLVTTKDMADKLKEAVHKIVSKEREMKAKLGQLEAMKSVADAQKRVAGAVKAAGAAAQAGGSVDNLADRVEKDAVRAQAAFDSAVGSLATDEDQTLAAEAKVMVAQIAAGAKPVGSPSTPTA